MVVRIFDLGIWEAGTNGSLEFKVILIYIVSSKTARATRENPASEKQTNN